MVLKIYQPTTAGRRGTSVSNDKDVLKRDKKSKKLVFGLKRAVGRLRGRITVRHKGGGEKRLLRNVDFKIDKFDLPAKVERLEYDPTRTAYLARLCFKDGERRYILAPKDIKTGDMVLSSQKQIEVKIGNRMPLKYIFPGTFVHNIELVPGEGGKMARSAGSYAVVKVHENNFTQLELPSKEMRLVKDTCFASVGQISRDEWRLVRWGKAGRMRHRGIRPSVRGKAMNPVDHPHGGGEGHNPIGLKHPKTYTGKTALGVKTREKKKWTNKYIIQRRPK